MNPALRLLLRRVGLLGRTTRTNLLLYLIVVVALNVAFFFFAVETGRASAPSPTRVATLQAIVFASPLLALVDNLIFMWLAARRFQDQDRPGWLVLAPSAAILLGIFIPFPPAFALLILIGVIVGLFLPGTLGPNRYGPDPRGWRSREHYEEERRLGRAS